MTTLQQIRGAYEGVVIAAASPVQVFVENQPAVEFDTLDEYCFVYVNYGMMQEPTVGCEYMEMIRGSLVCEIYTLKGAGPGRGLAIAQPIILALSALASTPAPPGRDFTMRVGRINGPTQAQLDDRAHHFTRFSCPIYARVLTQGEGTHVAHQAGPACLCIVAGETPPDDVTVLWLDTSQP